MKRLKTTLVALVTLASSAVPAFAALPPDEGDEGVVISQVAKISQGRGGTWGKAEWSSDQDTHKVRLSSWNMMGAVAGVAQVTLDSTKKYDDCLDIKSLEFGLNFKDQTHAHVRPTVRVLYISDLGSGIIDVNWNQYKDSHPSLDSSRYLIDVQKLMAEKSKEEREPCRVYRMLIGGREIRRDGFGNNAFLDVELRFVSIHAINRKTKQEYVVRREISTDVVRMDNEDELSKGLDGTV